MRKEHCQFLLGFLIGGDHTHNIPENILDKLRHGCEPSPTAIFDALDDFGRAMVGLSKSSGGSKIAAIKAYRTLTGAGLKDAKTAVESMIE